MDRRAIMALGALAGVFPAFGALAQAAGGGTDPVGQAHPKLTRVYAGPDGRSHIQVLEIATHARPIPVVSMVFSAYHPNSLNWHNAPAPQFSVNLVGELEAIVAEDEKRRIGPGDLVFIEDTTGKGHVTRLLTPVSNLYLKPPAGFDVVAWARGD
jgi:hypothetical protein